MLRQLITKVTKVQSKHKYYALFSLTFESADKVLWDKHSNATPSVGLSYNGICV